jgi:hypothetical protein
MVLTPNATEPARKLRRVIVVVIEFEDITDFLGERHEENIQPLPSYPAAGHTEEKRQTL